MCTQIQCYTCENINELAVAIERCTGSLLKDLHSTVSVQEFYGIDGEPIELEWNICSQDLLHWNYF